MTLGTAPGSSIESVTPVGGPARWSTATRFIFRVWFVFVLIMILPRSLEFFASVGVWPFIAETIGRWPIVHVLHRPEHLLAGPMSGADYLPDFIACGVLAGVSVVMALGWSLIAAPKRDHQRLFAVVYTLVRFLLGSLLLYYAWDKILPGQFGPGPNLEKVVRPAAQLTPMELLWAFMSSSRLYTVFSGLAEFAGGILLLTRRTALLGALISTFAMANVFMLDVAYDVGVKFLAGQMLAMALSLMAPYAIRLARILLLHEPHGLRPVTPLFIVRQRDDAARVIGGIVAIAAVCWTWSMAHGIVAETTGGFGPFHGVWEIDGAERDGMPLPLAVTDPTLWRRVVFPGDDGGAFVDTMSETETPYRVRIARAEGALTLTPRPYAAARARPTKWAFAFSGPDRLELRSRDSDASMVMKFRRADLSEWPMIGHQHGWRW